MYVPCSTVLELCFLRVVVDIHGIVFAEHYFSYEHSDSVTEVPSGHEDVVSDELV